MKSDNVGQWRRWFAYEQDAHALVLTSLRTLQADARSAAAAQKAVDLFAHILAARQMWLYRFGEVDEWLGELFPQGATIESVTLLAETVQAQWADYLGRLDDDELTRVFVYQSLEGRAFSNTIADILTQLFGHSWYHRGQIAALVRSSGCQPAVTDFVFWSRTPIKDDVQ